jgi:hypothetical protein
MLTFRCAIVDVIGAENGTGRARHENRLKAEALRAVQQHYPRIIGRAIIVNLPFMTCAIARPLAWVSGISGQMQFADRKPKRIHKTLLKSISDDQLSEQYQRRSIRSSGASE